MIKEFKDNPIRDTGIINRGMFEQVKMLYMQNPAAGGELAVSLMEQILTGDHSSDDFMVAFSIANHKETISRNNDRYDAAKDAKHEAIEASLREIADLYNAGLKQVEIARKLGVGAPAVSKKLSKIRKDFPHLLKDGNVSKVAEVSEKVSNDGNLGNVSKVSKNVSNEGNNFQFSEISGKLASLETLESLQENSETFLETLESSAESNKSFQSFQSFQHVYVNDNVNVNDNVAGKSSISTGQGCAPTPPKPKFDF